MKMDVFRCHNEFVLPTPQIVEPDTFTGNAQLIPIVEDDGFQRIAKIHLGK
jgi:hypothetical protein